jgi:hypothetical protein
MATRKITQPQTSGGAGAAPGRPASPRRFTVSGRLLVIVAAFTLPLGTMLSLIDLDKDIAFARQELRGNAYQRPLETLLHAIGDHQRLALAALRTPGGEAARSAAADRVDAAFATLAAADAAVGADLQVTAEGLEQRKRGHARFATVREEWQQARAVTGMTADTVADRHAHPSPTCGC